MTILDRQQLFSIDQDFGGVATGDLISTDQIDLLAGGYTLSDGTIANVGGVQHGVGRELYFYALSTESFVSSSSGATIQIILASDAVTAGHDSSSTVHYDSGAAFFDVDAGDLADETLLLVHRLRPDQTFLRYLAVRYVLATDTSSAGMIRAGIKTSVDQIPLYADSVKVETYT